MKRNYIYFLAIVMISAFFGLNSCKKPLGFSVNHLSFSADTIVFDTVFTTVGSVTQKLKIYNNDSKTLKIDQIELVGGANSPYRINVDGSSGMNFSGIELEGNDSLFIFVEVTLDPNNQNNPMIVEDQIRFQTNGKDQFVQLAAWGQDAYFHRSIFGTGNSDDLDLNEGVWPNDKPHVIYNVAFVDSAKTLEIPAGTIVHLHKNANLHVYKGTLNINGDLGDEVIFQGARLEPSYDNVSGQYYGIYFNRARPSFINYAIIKNGTTGIHLFGEDPANPPGGYTVQVTNTIIENCASYGIWNYRGGKVFTENSVISKCGIYAFFNYGGSKFNFNHCTIVGYGVSQEPAVAIGNYYVEDKTAYLVDIEEGQITNSAIYGNLENELGFDTISDPGNNLNFLFQYNNIKSSFIENNGFYANNIFNAEPVFRNPDQSDFNIWGTSEMKDAGSVSFPADNSFTQGADILKYTRNAPDIGAYEF